MRHITILKKKKKIITFLSMNLGEMFCLKNVVFATMLMRNKYKYIIYIQTERHAHIFKIKLER